MPREVDAARLAMLAARLDASPRELLALAARLAPRERIHSGKTIVFVSHDDEQIQQVCNRALWIEHGRSMMQGPVDAVLAAYHAAPPISPPPTGP